MGELYGFIEQLSGRSSLVPDDPPPSSLFEAIRDNLVILLNTRRGAIPFLSEYGLPDLSNIYKGYPDSLHYLGVEIKKTIERFEPRLSKVRIELVSSSKSYFEANYAITGLITNPKGRKTGVTFRTMISQGGRTQIGE